MQPQMRCSASRHCGLTEVIHGIGRRRLAVIGDDRRILRRNANEAAGAKPGLITRLFFFLLNLLKQFGENLFPRALPQRALKVRPARSFRRLRNAGPISAPGVQVPPALPDLRRSCS